MNPIRKLINAVKSLTEKKWERTTPAEKHRAKWIGRIATRFRGRRLTSEEMCGLAERLRPTLARI